MKRLLTLALALLFCLTACQKAPEIKITTPATIEMSSDGSNGTITFTANRDWTARASESWVHISQTSGEASKDQVTITVRCDANITYNDRTATVIITIDGMSQKVTITQPANLGIVLPTQAYDLQSDAKTIEVTVQANVDYSVETSVDWIKQTGTKALSSKTITFSIDENTTYDNREGQIAIKPKQAGVAEQVISVRQAQKDALNVAKTSYDMPYGGGAIEIKVESNVSFDVTPNADWIHYTQTKALSSSTVCLKIDENTTYSSRQGTVEIKQQNGLLKHMITVNQAGRIAVTSIELDVTSLTLKPGETATLVVIVKPDNATDKVVKWSNSDSRVVTVDDSGTLRAIEEGLAEITATAGDLQARCLVTVCPWSGSQPNNVVLYMSTDEQIVNPYGDSSSKFGAQIISNEYVNGLGIITFDGDVKRIDDHAFYADFGDGNFDRLTRVSLPESVGRIGPYAFAGCTNLISINIPEKVNSIEEYAFNRCSSLRSIILPKHLWRLGPYVFYGCTGLMSVILPEDLQYIGHSVFRGCKSLTSINIPKSVTSIFSYAFQGCRSLTSITIPDNVSSLGDHSFMGCESLTSVVLPKNLWNIHDYAFIKCVSLISITIPENTNLIGYGAFSMCSGLQEIVVLPENVPIGNYEMFDNTNDCPIYVPEDFVDAYKVATCWSDYADRIQAISKE